MTNEERAEIANYIDDMHERAKKIRVRTAMRVIKDFCTERVDRNSIVTCDDCPMEQMCVLLRLPDEWEIEE